MSDNKQQPKDANSKPATDDKNSKGFLERGQKGHDAHNMGNDISGDVKVANSNGELEGGDDKTWHINEGK